MKDVKTVVIACYKNLAEEKGLDIEPSLFLEMTRTNGIDSLGIVNLILDIEEELDIELDSYLAEIRHITTLQELVDIIEHNFFDN